MQSRTQVDELATRMAAALEDAFYTAVRQGGATFAAIGLGDCRELRLSLDEAAKVCATVAVDG